MRALLATLIAAAGLGMTGSAADAASGYYGVTKCKDCRPVAHYRYKRKKRETMDDIVARNLDPAGTYGAYPSWAQKALAPKGDGGRR